MAAELVFESIAYEVAKLCHNKMRCELDHRQAVSWSGEDAKVAAQQHGVTMEQSPLGHVHDSLQLLDDAQPDAWQTFRPLWVAFSRSMADDGLYMKRLVSSMPMPLEPFDRRSPEPQSSSSSYL